MSIGDWLLNPSGLTPHGFCLAWAPGLVGLHVASDAIIGLAYFSIPLAIAEFVRRRPDIRYGWVAYLFVAFILACGTTHFMSILTLWTPAYGAEGLIKAVTAALSIATAGLLWPLIPRAAALPSAAQLETQRDLLLREVYHRVKNNLQVVDSLLLMQSRRLSDAEAKAALEALRGRIYALGLVHHQLMGSDDLETFEIAPFLDELSRHLLAGGDVKGASLTVRAAPLKVGLDFAIPLGLLVTELVTDAMKHAFDDGRGSIEVTLDRSGAGELVLEVADDGRDGPVRDEAPPSLGGKIIEGLVQQLGGVMTVSTTGGVRAVVHLPAPVMA